MDYSKIMFEDWETMTDKTPEPISPIIIDTITSPTDLNISGTIDVPSDVIISDTIDSSSYPLPQTNYNIENITKLESKEWLKPLLSSEFDFNQLIDDILDDDENLEINYWHRIQELIDDHLGWNIDWNETITDVYSECLKCLGCLSGIMVLISMGFV